MKLRLYRDKEYNFPENNWGVWDLYYYNDDPRMRNKIGFRRSESMRNIWRWVKQGIIDHENQEAASAAKVD